MQSHSDDKVSPGQPFAAPRAETWNGMVDAGNAFRAGKLSSGTPEPTRPRQADIIKAKNASGAARSRGEILRFTGKAITDLSDEFIWLNGGEPTEDGYFGILKEPVENNAVAKVQVSGCCMAVINVTDASHTRARAVASSYVLQSGSDGPLEILYAPSGTGELECVVRFGGGSTSTLFAFALTADMVAKSAAADISTLDGASQTFSEASTVYDPQDIFATLNDGDTGLCIKQAGKYYIIQANCPDDAIPSSSLLP